MSDFFVQYLINERNTPPHGFQITGAGVFSRPAAENMPPDHRARLDRDRTDVRWQAIRQLDATQLSTIREAIQAAGFFELPTQLLINYCKEDPPAAIWQVVFDGRSARVVVFDPRPKRHLALDTLLATIEATIGE